MLKVMRSKTYHRNLSDSWNEGFAVGYDLGIKRNLRAIQYVNHDWWVDLATGAVKWATPRILRTMGLR